MIDLAAVLTDIGNLIPDIPEIVGSFPILEAAAPLAGAIGADPGTLFDAHDSLLSQHFAIGNILSDVAPHFASAVNDIVGIGGDFLAEAGRLLPNLLSPVPGHAPAAMAQLSLLPGLAFGRVQERIRGLENDLLPAVNRLTGVANDPPPVPPAAIPPAAQAAVPAPVQPEFNQAVHTAQVGHAVGGEVPGEPPVLPAPGEPAPAPAPAPVPSDNAAGEAAVAAAKSQIGTPYVWGGTTPGAGFDCSGLTQWAWRQAGVELPRLVQEQDIGRAVEYDELQAGDLLVWDGHVAMYDGEGSIVEAGDPVGVNPIRTTNMGMAFQGYYRPTG